MCLPSAMDRVPATVRVRRHIQEILSEDYRRQIVPFRRPLAGKAAEVKIKGQSLLPHITEFVAIQIQTDEGVTGEGLSLGGGLGMAHYLATTIKPLLIGRDPAYREAIPGCGQPGLER